MKNSAGGFVWPAVLGTIAFMVIAIGAYAVLHRGATANQPEHHATTSTTQQAPLLSANDAFDKVEKLSEVQKWMSRFTLAPGTVYLAPTSNEMSTSSAPVVELASTTADFYIIHVYEHFPDHDVTFNWYDVNKRTGKITTEFNQ